ncbi:hypothetical protein [Boudabousia marimammalium]|uniref:hypothetical protein n=1 Tax=Boudabousia marimammalium TaxID=156892 RepID=UPI0011785B50|nr:hypothetical protein [Boudabousia marimammalium]
MSKRQKSPDLEQFPAKSHTQPNFSEGKSCLGMGLGLKSGVFGLFVAKSHTQPLKGRWAAAPEHKKN